MASSNGLLCTQKHVCKLLQVWFWLHLIISIIKMSRLLWNGLCYFQCRDLTFFQDTFSLQNISWTCISLCQKCVSLSGVPITGTKSLNFRFNPFQKRKVLVEHNEQLRDVSFTCHTYLPVWRWDVVNRRSSVNEIL